MSDDAAAAIAGIQQEFENYKADEPVRQRQYLERLERKLRAASYEPAAAWIRNEIREGRLP